MNKIEQAIRDLQLYIDVKWGGRNDMLNLALAALREKAERKLDDNTIEAMRKQIEALQQENEQLQAQVARVREALRKAREVLYNLRMDDYPGFSAICDALATIDKAIGGKEDV
jgi:septal ring factor EnvC (AmiA/AmiB activator)